MLTLSRGYQKNPTRTFINNQSKPTGFDPISSMVLLVWFRAKYKIIHWSCLHWSWLFLGFHLIYETLDCFKFSSLFHRWIPMAIQNRLSSTASRGFRATARNWDDVACSSVQICREGIEQVLIVPQALLIFVPAKLHDLLFQELLSNWLIIVWTETFSYPQLIQLPVWYL